MRHMERVKDRTAQLSTGHPVRHLSALPRRTVDATVETVTEHWQAITCAAFAGLFIGLWNELTPWWVAILSDLAGLTAIYWYAVRPRLLTGFTYRERNLMLWLATLWDAARISPAPSVRRQGGRLDFRVSRNSWTIELDVITAANGVASAKEFCSIWPRLKTEAGEGCIGVYLHERRGRHVSMVVVWEREAGDRTVLVASDRVAYVCATKVAGYRHWNPSLGGWVLQQHAHASEYYPSPGELERMRVELDDDDQAEPEPDLEDDDELDDGDTAGIGESHDDEEPRPTWPTEEAAQTVESGCNQPAGGVEPTTPPAELKNPFTAPPSGPRMSGLFAPWEPLLVYPERPRGAEEGTATGRLWDLLCDDNQHQRADLAEATGMAAGSVGNALTAWARLGIVNRSPEGWHAVVSHQAGSID